MSKVKQILYVTAEFPPCGGGGVGRSFTAVHHLAEAGFRVTVLCASENSYTFLDPSYPATHENVEKVPVWTPELRHWIRRIKTRVTAFNPTDRFFLWRYFAARKAALLHKQHSFDLVISSYPFFSNHAVAYELVKKADLPWIADYRDPPWWMYSAQHKVQPEFYEFSHRTTLNVVTTERSKQLLINKLSLSSDDVSVIANGCDILAAHIETSIPNGKHFELLHTGSVYEEGRDINLLIEVVSQLSQSVRLRFVGDPPYQSTKELLAKLEDTSFVEFSSYVPAAEALKQAAKTNVLVVIQGEIFENQVPGKVFEYLALQKTILLISNEGSATHQLLANEPNVIFAEYGNADSILRGIEQAKSHSTVTVDRTRYTRLRLGEHFVALTNKILNSRNSK